MPGARHTVSWSWDSYCSGCQLLHACKHASNKWPCFLREPWLALGLAGEAVYLNFTLSRHNFENSTFTYEPIVIGAGCVLGERASIMGHSTLQDRAQLMPMAQAMKGMTLVEATRSAGNPADTVRPSDAWWAPLGHDLVPLRQIVVEHPSDAVSHAV